jgi:3-hydroxyacyl-[acyl-carrier-protein] dehydratase
MLLNRFFEISNLQANGPDITATLTINRDHEIFAGHFPGQPVVPGVCMMQMIKEIMEQVTGKKMNIVKAHDMKFLAVIDPTVSNCINVVLKYTQDTEGNIVVTATLMKEEILHFKFKGQFGFQ